ncbi:MAG: EsaB/YukD family protein [Clostridium sp.]|nr:EsaB/YukD family protein [Clostridium sp.]MCM1170728.1 EsaB/YukD family protein [Clostridium sp.]MCM1209126.1 EsaB/YukD family protein [Ruminococcus sp.]
MDNTVILVFNHVKMNKQFDIEVPLNITANEFIYGLNAGFHLGIDMNNVAACYLCTEEPKALLRGDRLLEDFGLRDGTIITYRK